MDCTASHVFSEANILELCPLESHKTGLPEQRGMYSGHGELTLSRQEIGALCSGEKVPVSSSGRPQHSFLENQCFVVTANGGISSLAIYKAGNLRRIIPPPCAICGVKPRNKEQHFALAVLSDDSIHAVSLAGQAGTGKTLLALAVGIHKVLARDRFQRVLVTKPIVPVGRHDLGFLPGKKEDKILPWVQSMVDNLSCLSRGTQRLTWEHLRESKIVEVESVGYLRGRSIANTWMIVDEAQNLTPHEVKTVLSRASEGTKVVLTGDVEQIDAPFMNSNTNGLSHVVQRLRGEPLFAHILFSKTVRSPLAALAASLL